MALLVLCRRSPLAMTMGMLFALIPASVAWAQSGTGACCLPAVGGGCQVLTAAQCAAANGILLDGQPCGNCNALAACCAGPLAACQVVSASGCASQGGTLFSTCSPDPCLLTVAVGACCNQATGVCTADVPPLACAAPLVWYASPTTCTPNPCAALGACCLGGPGACTQTTQASCAGIGWTANTSCASAMCGQLGACCTLLSAMCTYTNFADCQGVDSQFSLGQLCNPDRLCGRGACCFFANGACSMAYKAECTSVYSGQFYLNGTCSAGLCSGQHGACCTPNVPGGCAVTTPAQCPASSSFTLNSTCIPNACPTTLGACCCPGGDCSIGFQSSCTRNVDLAAGSFPRNCNWLANVACTATTCPPLGACCVPSPVEPAPCFVSTLAECPGQWQQSIACAPNPCPTLGACCNLNTGACSLQASSTSCAGQWFAGVPCQPNSCARGGCCNPIGGSCLVTTHAACVAHGLTWLGVGIPCTPTNCQSTLGACCTTGQSACVTTTRSACIGTYLAREVCSPNPCCRADFDGGGALGVGDIFSFLSTWFAGCP